MSTLELYHKLTVGERFRGFSGKPRNLENFVYPLGRDWLFGAAMLAVVLSYFAVFCIINFAGFERFCTGDMYEDTYVAKLFWEQKTLFPENWVFGNQYYVITTPVLAALFYGMGCTVNTAMAMATTVMTVLILISLFWMLQPFAGWKGAMLGCALMVSVVTAPYIVDAIEGQIFYLMASYYAGYLVTLFVVFGAYLRARRSSTYKGFVPLLIVSAALSFCTGMQSLRQTAIMALPLAVYEIIRWLPRLREVWDTLHILHTRQNTHVLKRAMLEKLAREKSTILALTACVFNLLGYGMVRLIDPKSVTIYGEVQAQTAAARQESMQTAIRGLQSITGLKYLNTESWNGFIGGFCLFLVCVVATALVLRFRERNRKEDLFAYLDLCVLSLITVFAIGVTTDISLRSIYFFVWYPLVTIAGVVLFRLIQGIWKGIFTLVLTAFMVGNLFVSYGECVEDALSDERPLMADVAQWIEDHGYTIIYGEWNTVTEIAAWSDGALTAGAWSDKLYRPLDYINPLDIYSKEDNEKAIHVMIPWTKEPSLFHGAMHDVEMEKKAHFIREEEEYELYTSSEQLMVFTPRYRPSYAKHIDTVQKIK